MVDPAAGVSALSGVKILEWGDFVSAPFCAKLLAGLGAEVLKVESPFGDPARQYGPFPGDTPHSEKSGLFLYLNTNKQGITLDATNSEGRKIFEALLNDADILVENKPVGVTRKLQLDYANLKRRFPRLIVTSITPFGQDGPYANRDAYDVNLCALGEVSFCVGERDRTPLATPCFQSEYQGGISGAIGALLALLARKGTGRGQHVDISMLDIWCALHAGGKLMNFVYFGGISDHRQGRRRELPYPFVHLPCKNGYVSICTLEDHHWETFLKLVGDQDLINNPRYKDRRAMAEKYPEEVDAKLVPWLMQRTKGEIFSLCRKEGLPFAPVRNIEEVINCPQLRERRYFEELDHVMCGKLRYPGAPFKLSATPMKMMKSAPLLGEYNEEILCGGLGYSKKELLQLRQTGVI
jgi:crotonobetainyl-CoA:carnitine CoA-transferase CaiB-like acyl-CoA transferase